MKYPYIIIFLIVNSFSLNIKSQETGCPVIRNYTVQEYKNEPQVLCCIQGQNGLMYFGVSGEIMEYDGVNWRSFSIDNQEVPYGFAMDKKGKIYVAANNEFGYIHVDKKGFKR